MKFYFTTRAGAPPSVRHLAENLTNEANRIEPDDLRPKDPSARPIGLAAWKDENGQDHPIVIWQGEG